MDEWLWAERKVTALINRLYREIAEGITIDGPLALRDLIKRRSR